MPTDSVNVGTRSPVLVREGRAAVRTLLFAGLSCIVLGLSGAAFAASDTGKAAAAGGTDTMQGGGSAKPGTKAVPAAQQGNNQGVACKANEVPTGHGSCVMKKGGNQ